jgi:hypothetical protein
MFVSPVTEDEVQNVVSKLKGKFSAGYDEIPEKLVKECIQFIKKALTFILNISLYSGTFPNLMEKDKKGGKQEISNYRPISILPVFSTVLKTLIYKRVVTFLNKHNVIPEAQNGFRENKSTNTATQTFIEDIQKALDNRLFVMGVFLDLTRPRLLT